MVESAAVQIKRVATDVFCRIIGSVGLTVPAAVWLMGQGPKKSDHGHEDHGDSHVVNEDKEEHEPASDEKDQDQPNSEKEYSGEGEPQQEEKEEAKSDSDDSKAESDDKGSEDSGDEKAEKSETDGADQKDEKDDKSKEKQGDDSGPKKSEDGYELPGPNAPGQINYRSGLGKGPGEGGKGDRPRTETAGEKGVSISLRINSTMLTDRAVSLELLRCSEPLPFRR